MAYPIKYIEFNFKPGKTKKYQLIPTNIIPNNIISILAFFGDFSLLSSIYIVGSLLMIACTIKMKPIIDKKIKRNIRFEILLINIGYIEIAR